MITFSPVQFPASCGRLHHPSLPYAPDRARFLKWGRAKRMRR